MPKRKPTWAGALLSSVSTLLVVACGSSPPPAMNPEAPPPAAPAVAEAADDGDALEEEGGESGEPESLPSDVAEEREAAPQADEPRLPEPKDDCTPASVEFEKRARPKVKDCYAQGKKKDPNLEGTVKIKIDVDARGKIKSTKVTENTLTDAVASCMVKVIKATPFPDVDKCWNASVTIPVTFPTPP